MLPGVSKEQAAKARLLGRSIRAEITLDEPNALMTLKLITTDEKNPDQPAKMIRQMATTLATLLNTIFGINGKIINTKDEPKQG